MGVGVQGGLLVPPSYMDLRLSQTSDPPQKSTRAKSALVRSGEEKSGDWGAQSAHTANWQLHQIMPALGGFGGA